MRPVLLIASILLSSTVFSQKNKVDFSAIDRRVEMIKPASPEILSAQLVAGCSTELEKVRAIFRWIAYNISYRIRETARGDRFAASEEIDTGALKPLNERVSESVLKKGSAICDGYSRLFKTLCDYAGINAEIIHGYVRAGRASRRFGCNHTWNAVMIDNKWELLDVTWASGYISLQRDHFVRDFDENYFLSAPEKFIQEHYPDDLRWTLMTDPPLLTEFRYSPYKQKTFIKYSIRSYSPAKGIIEVSEGDTLRFELESSDPARDRQIYSDFFPDTSAYKTANSVLLQPSTILNNKTIYTYYVTSASVEWLYLLYNDDVVLRYRLQKKKEKKDMASLQ